MREFLRKPGPKYIRLARAMSRDESFGKRALAEAPAAAYVVEIEVRYRDRRGQQLGDTLGFQLLTPVAETNVRQQGEIISEVS